MFILKAAISLYGTQTACPVCRNCIDETDIMPLSGNLLFIYESLQVKCSHSQCNLKISLKNVKFDASIWLLSKCSMSTSPIPLNCH
jgi:hypothetical protein